MKGEDVESLAREYEISKGHLYRLTADQRSRRRRSDHGRRKVPVTPAQLEQLCALVYGLNFDPRRAIENAEENGIIQRDVVSASWFADHLRNKLHLTRRQSRKSGPRVARRFERQHPQQMHQADATRAGCFYIDASGDICYDPRRPWKWKAKERGRTPLHIFGLIDDCSRVLYLRGYDGETVLNWFDFFLRAWSVKDDHARFPFWGMPSLLYMDNTSAVRQSYAGQRIFVEGLVDVKLITHVPECAWSKGKIERAFRTFQDEEPATRIEKFSSFDDLNLWLDRVALHLNNRQHSAHGMAPFARWTSGVDAASLREPPDYDTWQRWLLREAEVVISRELRIRFDGEEVELPRTPTFIGMVGRRVRVLYERGTESDLIIVDRGCEYVAQRLRPGAAAWVDQQADTRTEGEKMRERVADIDLSKLDLQKRLDRGVRADWDVPTRGRKFEATGDIAAALRAAPITRSQFIEKCRTAGLFGEELSDADARFVDSVMTEHQVLTAEDADGIIQKRKTKAAVPGPVVADAGCQRAAAG